MSLYNLKTADGEYRITKFTNDLEVESSYIVSENECACPAGARPSCRHRQMLPKMLNVGAEDSGMFYDFDHDQFLEPLSDSEDTQSVIVSPLEDSSERSDTELANTEPQFLEGLSQTVETTINYTEDGSVEVVETHSALSPQASLPSYRQIHDGVVTPEMEIMLKAESPHPAITGTLKRRI